MPKKWGKLAALGTALLNGKKSSKTGAEEGFACAYLSLVQTAAAAGVDLDAAVNRELRKRGVNPEEYQVGYDVPATRGRKIGKKS